MEIFEGSTPPPPEAPSDEITAAIEVIYHKLGFSDPLQDGFLKIAAGRRVFYWDNMRKIVLQPWELIKQMKNSSLYRESWPEEHVLRRDIILSCRPAALQSFASGIVSQDVKDLLKWLPVTVEWNDKEYIIDGDIVSVDGGLSICMKYQRDTESEVDWNFLWVLFKYSTEESAWLDSWYGKPLNLSPERPLKWMEHVKGAGRLLVDIPGAEGIIRSRALKSLDTRAKRNWLVWTRGKQTSLIGDLL